MSTATLIGSAESSNTPVDVGIDVGVDVDVGLAASRDETWANAPWPVLVIDPLGVIRASSASARDVMPGATPDSHIDEVLPAWLYRAHLAVVRSTAGDTPVVSGELSQRHFDAHAARLPGGDVAWWLAEDTGRRSIDAQRALVREQERATLLAEVSAVLTASLNVDRCMEATVQLAALHLADAAVLVAPPARLRLPVVCSGSNNTAEARSVDAEPAEVPGLVEALRGFPPVPSRWIDPASVPDWLLPNDFDGPVGSVVITPLPGHGVPAGALVLLRRTSHTAFTEGEEVFARLFAARAGAALSAAQLYAEQAAVTRTLMRELLPPQLHRVHGFELAGGYRASDDHQVVGGDFYDVHPAAVPEEETLIVLGDVCGKGLEAAVLTGKIRNTLQALAPLAGDHEEVLRLLNGAMLSASHTRFATLVLTSAVCRDAQVELRLTSAGHPPPLIVRNDGRVERADTRGSLIGVLPQVAANTYETSLAPGETCLLYTDGVTEARSGLDAELFGDDRLAAALAECVGMPPEAVVERILMLTGQWLGTRAHDDIALVAITAPQRTRLSAVDGHTAGRYTHEH